MIPGRIEEHQQGLAKFLLPDRRVRFLAALHGKPAARSKEVARLPHRPGLDPQWARPVSPAGPLAALLARLEAELDAADSDEVYVVSDDPELDGRTLTRSDALRRVVPTQASALISVVPGRLALYSGERVDDVLVLKR